MFEPCRKHLEHANESYVQHMLFALRFAAKMIIAAFAIIIHALVPALFETTGSRMLCSLYDELKTRAREPVCPVAKEDGKDKSLENMDKNHP